MTWHKEPTDNVIPLHGGPTGHPARDELPGTMAETCAALKAQHVPFKQLTGFHLKIGRINYYPSSGIAVLDGQKRSPGQGFQNLLQILRANYVLRPLPAGTSALTSPPPSPPTLPGTPPALREQPVRQAPKVSEPKMETFQTDKDGNLL
jgi:hypothetical protein